MLAIEVMDKERIMIERVVEQFEGFQVVEDPQREGQADGRDDREERKEIQEMIQEMPEKKEEDGEIYWCKCVYWNIGIIKIRINNFIMQQYCIIGTVWWVESPYSVIA